MKWMPSLVLLATVSLVGAQQNKPEHPKHSVTTVADNKLVTQSEARHTFIRARKMLTAALKISLQADAVKIPNHSKGVSRSQVIDEMWTLYRQTRSSYKYRPALLRYDAKVFQVPAAQKAHLGELVQLGFVGRVAPLAVGPKSTLTVKQFGDAVGLFLARVSDLSNLPSSRWTPSLSGGTGE